MSNVGHYRVAAPSGNLSGLGLGNAGPGLGATIWSFSWVDPSNWSDPDSVKVAVVHYLRAEYLLITAFGSAQRFSLAAWLGRGQTTQPTGGQLIVEADPGGLTPAQRMAPQHPISTGFDMRIATTGSGFGIGNEGDADFLTEPIARAQGWAGVVGDTVGFELNLAANDFHLDRGQFWSGRSHPHPIVLGEGDILSIANWDSFGATGTVILNVECAWSEQTLRVR